MSSRWPAMRRPPSETFVSPTKPSSGWLPRLRSRQWQLSWGGRCVRRGATTRPRDSPRSARSSLIRDNVAAQMLWRTTRSKTLARRQRLEEAESLARQACEITEETDALNSQGLLLTMLAEASSPRRPWKGGGATSRRGDSSSSSRNRTSSPPQAFERTSANLSKKQARLDELALPLRITGG